MYNKYISLKWHNKPIFQRIISVFLRTSVVYPTDRQDLNEYIDHTDFVIFAPTGRTLERPLKERALSFCQFKYPGKISLVGCTVPY
ncbi:hypothetical protein JH26_01095 [Microvirga sp. BSC39]|nr:hypothetical protein JH26_01095 [Microvirga sp. BSC39]